MSTFAPTFTAGEVKEYPGGNFFFLLEASTPVDIRFFRNGSAIGRPVLAMEAGYERSIPEGFDYVEITSAGAQSIKFMSLQGEARTNRQVGAVDINSPAAWASVADASITGLAAAASILAANAQRREAIITSLSSNGADVRIGDSNVGAARGSVLEPGGSMVVATTAEVFAYSAAAATLAITYTE